MDTKYFGGDVFENSSLPELSCSDEENSSISLASYEKFSPCASLWDTDTNSSGDYSNNFDNLSETLASTVENSIEKSSNTKAIARMKNIHFCGRRKRNARFNPRPVSSGRHTDTFTCCLGANNSNYFVAINGTYRRTIAKNTSFHRVTTRRRLNYRHTNKCSYCQSVVARGPNPRVIYRGLCNREKLSRELCSRATTPRVLYRHATATRVSRLQEIAAKVSYHRAATGKVSCRRATIGRDSCHQEATGINSFHQPTTGHAPCHQVAHAPCHQAAHAPCHQAASAPCHQVASVRTRLHCCFKCSSISNSGHCDRSVYYYLSLSSSCSLERVSKTLTYQRKEALNHQTESIAKYHRVTFQKSRSSQQVRSKLESKSHFRRGVLAFPRRRRGGHPCQGYEVILRQSVANLSLDPLDVEGSEQNSFKNQFSLVKDEKSKQLHDKAEHFCRCFEASDSDLSSKPLNKNKIIKQLVPLSNTRDCKELVQSQLILNVDKYSNEDLMQSNEGRKSNNEEKHIDVVESDRNLVPEISDSSNNQYALVSNKKIGRIGSKATFVCSNNIRIYKREPSKSLDYGLIETEFSKNSARMKRAQLNASNNDSNRDHLKEDIKTEKSEFVIYSDADHKAKILPFQSNNNSFMRPSNYRFEILSRRIKDKTRHLRELIRIWKSTCMGDDSDSSSEFNVSNYFEKGKLDSFFESNKIDVEAEFFDESLQSDSIEYDISDKYELEKHIPLASPINIIEDFCVNLMTKCLEVSGKHYILLSERSKNPSDVESTKFLINAFIIRKKMEILEGIIRHFQNWCEEYYKNITKVFLEFCNKPALYHYWKVRILQFNKSLVLLATLREFWQNKQFNFNFIEE